MERKKSLAAIVLLSALLIIPAVFVSGLVNVPQLTLFSGGASSSSSTPTVLINPNEIVKDYEFNPDYRIGNKFNVTVDVSNVVDLYSWQINATWDPSILDVSRIFGGEFLRRTGSADKTASYQLGFVINATDNTKGHSAMSESILGDVAGITGSGTLVKIEFLIVGYGWTWLNISRTGTLATTLLNSTVLSNGQPATITFDKSDGWFDNRLTGDVNCDHMVSVADRGEISDHWTGPPVGLYPYARYCDLYKDDRIGVADRGIVSDNWGRTFPIP